MDDVVYIEAMSNDVNIHSVKKKLCGIHHLQNGGEAAAPQIVYSHLQVTLRKPNYYTGH